MNLVLVIPELRAGGSERVFSQLATHWASQGNKVSLITLDHPGIKPFYPLHPTIDIIQLDQKNLDSCILKRVINIFRRIVCLRSAITHLRPDLIVSFLDIMNMTTLIANVGLGIPVVISERIDPNFRRLPVVYNWLRKIIYPFCVRLVVQTQSTASYFPPKFKNFIRIIPNPVTLPMTLKDEHLETKTVQHIISVGRLDLQKDHETLIRAFATIVESYPNVRLSIYGEGTERTKLERLIDSLKLEGKVFLPGVIEDIYPVLAKADLFIFSSRFEGFPNALCEAMAVGLPVIASNCSGNVDVVREGIDGRLFPVGDQEALARVACELIGDFEQRQRLSLHAREIVTRFHPDRIFALWDNVLKEQV